MDFVEKIHHYFTSPQRKAKLAAIQKRNCQKKLMLCHYVETRWLSLGESLERLLEIWTSLIEYMKTVKDDSGSKNFNKADCLSHLESDSFYLQILFLTKIINRINRTNIIFQSSSLEIQYLKLEMLALLQWIGKPISFLKKYQKTFQHLWI